MSVTYKSDIRLGERYRDEQTGIEGTATAVYFYQFGCERVGLEFVVDGKIEDKSFDAPRLTRVKTGVRATVFRTGGPERGASPERPGPAS